MAELAVCQWQADGTARRLPMADRWPPSSSAPSTAYGVTTSTGTSQRRRLLEAPPCEQGVTTVLASSSSGTLNTVPRLARDEAPEGSQPQERSSSSDRYLPPSEGKTARQEAIQTQRRGKPPANWGGSRGGRDLREFLAAPATVQAEFIARLAREIAAETDFRRYLADVDTDDPVPPRPPLGRLVKRPTRWSDVWRKRAQGVRSGLKQDGRNFETERSALLSLSTSAYVEVLTDERAVGGKLPCPLPDHDERTGSFHTEPEDEGLWYCHGCHRGGSVYDLAAALWGLGTRGKDFRELHDRLCRMFDVRETA